MKQVQYKNAKSTVFNTYMLITIDVSTCTQCNPLTTTKPKYMRIVATQDDLHGDQDSQGHGVQSQVTPPAVVMPEVTTNNLHTSDP